MIPDDIELDFDKQLIKDLIAVKRNGLEKDSYMCPEWLITWYSNLDIKMMEQCNKKRGASKITLPDDIFIKYYLDCVNKYI